MNGWCITGRMVSEGQVMDAMEGKIAGQKKRPKKVRGIWRGLYSCG